MVVCYEYVKSLTHVNIGPLFINLIGWCFNEDLLEK